MNRTFKKDFMLEVLDARQDTDINGHKVKILEDTMIEHRRWAIGHRLVFSCDDKLYQTTYDYPATECQEYEPWWKDDVECIEVRPVEKTVIVYEAVKGEKE